jgi:hypothetical protein
MLSMDDDLLSLIASQALSAAQQLVISTVSTVVFALNMLSVLCFPSGAN